MIIHVGRPRPEDDTKKYSYRDVKFDKDGWASVKDYLPLNCDLVLTKNDSGKTYFGWYTGSIWDGLRIRSREVKFWKRSVDEQF